MCHNRTTNRKINRLRERCLRIIYDIKQSSYKMLLEKEELSKKIDYNSLTYTVISSGEEFEFDKS